MDDNDAGHQLIGFEDGQLADGFAAGFNQMGGSSATQAQQVVRMAGNGGLGSLIQRFG